MLQNQFGFNIEEIVRMIDYGFKSAFIDETIKRRLRIEAHITILNVLKKHGIDISPIVENSIYYLSTGIRSGVPFHPLLTNTKVTLDLIQALPKADPDTRFIGSIPLDILWKFYENADPKQHVKTFETKEDFVKFCTSLTLDPGHDVAKKVAIALLQGEANIREACHACFAEAYADNVQYMEFTVCPFRHSHLLTEHQFLDIVNEEIEKFTADKEMTIHQVIFINPHKDSPLIAQRLAELAVEYKEKNVVGFAIVSEELTSQTIEFFQPTFDYLRTNFISVWMFAGEKDSSSIPIAIVRGNARRIAGGFQVAESCSLLKEVTSNGISVQVAPTPRMSAGVGSCFEKQSIRSFYDFGVKVTFTSIHQAFTGMTRSAQLYEICESSGFDVLDLVQIIYFSFGAIFEHYAELKKRQINFMKKALELLKERNIETVFTPPYYLS